MNPEIRIVCRFPTDDDLTEERVQGLSALINAVYDDAESGMWKRKGIRTTPDEVKRLLKEKRLILAEIGGVVVGSVNVNLLSGRIGELGMLVSDVNHRGKGVGSALVKAAEQWAKRIDCETMQLELLTPRRWKHPSKEFLKRWYRKIGYEPQIAESFEKLSPDKFAELATDCDFMVWHKRLV
jgi:GNAT superfamily N-acetyltransferase